MSEALYLAVALARAGYGSRRSAVELINQGRVKVNDTVVAHPNIKVAEHDRITVDDQLIKQSDGHIYIMLNKPTGYICSRQDERGRPTVFDILPERYRVPGLLYVGRLDEDSSGLLLLTTDGTWAQKIQHPRYGVNKTYVVTVDRPCKPSDQARLREGIVLHDGFIKPDRLEEISHNARAGCTFTVELHSGRKRIIRRMFAAVGYHVVDLQRITCGPWSLDGLALGACRPFNPF